MQNGQDGKVGNSTSLTAIFLMIFSAALLLFLIGLYMIIGLHSDNVVQFLKEHTAVVFELNSQKSDPQKLISQLQKESMLRGESIEFISAEEGLGFMKNEMGGDVIPQGMENPFSDLIISYIRAEFSGEDDLALLRKRWISQSGIREVYFQNDYLQFWDAWKQRIFRWTSYVTILLLGITIMLIFNTVKLTIFMKQKSIEILELVGATWDFIRQPYLRVGVKMGLVSALLASIGISFLLSFLAWRQPELTDYFNWYYMLLTILVLIGFGMLLQYLSTYVVVTRVLRNRVKHLK